MWMTISRFELRYQLRQPLVAASAVLFFALGLALASSSVGTAFGDSPGTMIRNAPVVIVRLMPVISLLGLFAITAFVASSALRDFDRRSDMLFFTKPLRRIDYLGGRFVGSMIVSSLVLAAAVVGLMLGPLAPWQPADRIAAFSALPYLYGVATILVPNLLIMGSLFFALAVSSRRLSLTFLCVVFFIGVQDAVELAAQHLENPMWGALLEPSGIVAFETMIRYWTIAEQNSQLPPIGGLLLANRLLWLTIAGAVLGLSWWRFDPAPREPRRRRARGSARSSAASTAADRPAVPSSLDAIQLPTVHRRFDTPSRLRQVLRQARIELSEVVVSTPFVTLLAFGMMFVGVFAWIAGLHDGMPSFPLTHLMLQAIQLGARLTLVLIVVLYAGELVASQRSLKLSDVYDALPVANTTLLAAKIVALLAVVGIFLGVGTATTLLVQGARGPVDVDLALYARGLVVIGLPIALLVVLAVGLQVLANHKLLGLLLTVSVLLLRFALPKLGIESNLLLYANHPPITYSELNGYGHHAEPFVWFMAYWSLGAALLWVVGALFWPRGPETAVRVRLATARRRLSRPVIAAATAIVLAMVGLGGWLFAETHRDGGAATRHQIIQRLADYESQYSRYRDLPLPTITAVTSEVDVYPARRQVEVRGRYRLENQGSEPIRTVPITRSPRWVEGVLRVYGGVSIEHLGLPPHTDVVDDDRLGFYVVELEQPLRPGQSIDMDFHVRVDHDGLVNKRHNDLVVANGTFFSNRNVFPVLGYAAGSEIQNPGERSKRGLPAIERARAVDDPTGRQRNYLGADWIDFEMTVSTSKDQVAIAPGRLVESWSEGERSFFRYATSTPIVDLFPVLSGRWAVARERWNDVEIEIYHHPDHATNIEHFLDVTRRTLDYMSRHFGPYSHPQLRIVEVPSYHDKTAFAFGQTIVYSESWGFSADLEHAELDWLAGVLAHEVAHQWWNHQVVPADVQGATWIAESLPQYAAMQVLEELYGPQAVRRFLKFHLDRYLERRGHEAVREMPLALVENQAYIHYSKASLALYALGDRVGDDTVNRAMRGLIDDFAFQGPPYPTSADLLDHLRRAVPEAEHDLLVDLFETVTLFDLRVVDATFTPLDDGRYRVEIDTTSTKWRDDGHGELTEIDIDDWIDVGVFGEDDGREIALILEPRHLRTTANRFTFEVDRRPVRVGIDPYNKLVDRISGDNVRPVTAANP